nr:accessory gland protein Acp29AB-like [Drosophila takahashii]
MPKYATYILWAFLVWPQFGVRARAQDNSSPVCSLAVESHLAEIKESVKRLSVSLGRSLEIPAIFEQIGNRYFYIEKENRQNWFAAANTCRKMGGHLATIQNQEEMDAIAPKLPAGVFWLDITDLAKEGEHVSSLTGKRPPFFNWKENEPAPINEHCVNLYTDKMCDANCNAEFFFICQYI